MKNPERVAQLLAELRELADNDFELHRIDVLERDLTTPPTVEIIDDTHQRFNGVTYCKRAHSHFFINQSIHQAVWRYCVGKIPTGCVIHHIDHNKNNNNVANLQCLTVTEHQQVHNQKGKPVAQKQKKQFVCSVCGKTFEAFDNGQLKRYCSKRCHNVERYHTTRKKENICQWCGKKFFGKITSRFCSGHCATTAHYAHLRENQSNS